MEERVPIMEQNHSSPMSKEPESPTVFGCSECLRIFSTDTFCHGTLTPGYEYCVGCGAPGLEPLGVLPMVMEENEKFFLIDDEDGVVTGPYDTQDAAQSDIWGWFRRKEEHGKVITKGRKKGHLRLAAAEGVVLEEDNDREENPSKESG